MVVEGYFRKVVDNGMKRVYFDAPHFFFLNKCIGEVFRKFMGSMYYETVHGWKKLFTEIDICGKSVFEEGERETSCAGLLPQIPVMAARASPEPGPRPQPGALSRPAPWVLGTQPLELSGCLPGAGYARPSVPLFFFLHILRSRERETAPKAGSGRGWEPGTQSRLPCEWQEPGIRSGVTQVLLRQG